MIIHRIIFTICLLLSSTLVSAQVVGSVTETVLFPLRPASNQLAGESYDANGNQTSDLAQGIVHIKYNILNLPEVVTYSDSTKVYYLYSASGAKLREVVIPGGTGETETTDYTGNLIYKNGTLHKVLTGSGYIESGDSTSALLSSPSYRYFLTDHLGSVRVLADAQGNILHAYDYTPYGEDFQPFAYGGEVPPGNQYPAVGIADSAPSVIPSGASTVIPSGVEESPSSNPYRFSAKELVRTGHYDFGARWYSPRSARWSTMDPLAEKYYSISPYTYCAGNPVSLSDPHGDSLRVLNNQEIFMQSMTDVFGDYAANFSIDDNGNVSYSGSTEGMSRNQIKVLNGVLDIIEKKEITTVRFDNDFYDYGGGNTVFATYPNGVCYSEITINPKAPNTMKVLEVTDAYYIKPIDPANGIRFIEKEISTNTTDKLFHEFGHVIYDGKPQSAVIYYNNIVRKILKMKKRKLDETHNDTKR